MSFGNFIMDQLMSRLPSVPTRILPRRVSKRENGGWQTIPFESTPSLGTHKHRYTRETRLTPSRLYSCELAGIDFGYKTLPLSSIQLRGGRCYKLIFDCNADDAPHLKPSQRDQRAILCCVMARRGLRVVGQPTTLTLPPRNPPVKLQRRKLS